MGNPEQLKKFKVYTPKLKARKLCSKRVLIGFADISNNGALNESMSTQLRMNAK